MLYYLSVIYIIILLSTLIINLNEGIMLIMNTIINAIFFLVFKKHINILFKNMYKFGNDNLQTFFQGETNPEINKRFKEHDKIHLIVIPTREETKKGVRNIIELQVVGEHYKKEKGIHYKNVVEIGKIRADNLEQLALELEKMKIPNLNYNAVMDYFKNKMMENKHGAYSIVYAPGSIDALLSYISNPNNSLKIIHKFDREEFERELQEIQ